MTARRQALGRAGEDAAAAWYEAAGWEVLHRNWRVREGELDLVVWRDGVLAVCEVKARSSAAYGLPAEAVTWRKQQRIRGLARRYLSEWSGERPRPVQIRFDVVAVTGHRVEVIEGAF